MLLRMLNFLNSTVILACGNNAVEATVRLTSILIPEQKQVTEQEHNHD